MTKKEFIKKFGYIPPTNWPLAPGEKVTVIGLSYDYRKVDPRCNKIPVNEIGLVSVVKGQGWEGYYLEDGLAAYYPRESLRKHRKKMKKDIDKCRRICIIPT